MGMQPHKENDKPTKGESFALDTPKRSAFIRFETNSPIAIFLANAVPGIQIESSIKDGFTPDHIDPTKMHLETPQPTTKENDPLKQLQQRYNP